MHALAARLFALPRSLTGDGVRATLAALGELVPLTVVEVPTGTPVLDWTVPKEWNLRRAVLRGPGGEIVADTARRNLEVVGYSVPVRGRFPLAELRPRLHSLPDKPDLVPYRTSYWQESWGFCLPHRVLAALPDGEYEVEIDTTLADGHLTYGELLLPGASPAEILVSCHVCHPALANDNLSGLAVSAFLARELAGRERRWSWRFLWAPGTIGAIAWLARNEAVTARIRAGLVAANLGDPGAFHYKRSRRGDTEIDRAVEIALRDLGVPHALEEFVPFGYDERQYCSPGFDLPVGLLSRTSWGRFPEYHTSADDLDFIRPEALAGSLAVYRAVAGVLEGNRRFRNLSPKGEPQLGRRGLYRALGGDDRGRERELALLWVLNQSDGGPDLLAIARRSGLPFERLREAAAALAAAGLIAPDPD
jgi:aminopeptidase-like protein